MFNDLKRLVQEKFIHLAKQPLFFVEIDRDEIWQRYLSGFPDETRQENNCNACKSFLRQYGGIVGINSNLEKVTLFDISAPAEYAQAIENVRNYVHSLPITDIFLNDVAKCGVDKNLDAKSGIVWQHFFIELSRQLVDKDFVAKRGTARETKAMLKRALTELTVESTETVLELIAQGSLYRGAEFKGVLETFLKIQKEYVYTEAKDNYCWLKSRDAAVVSRIRNTAIGTLLIDLSNEVELNAAVSAYERVMAPANYKRPTALVTPKMLEQARQTLANLNLLDALERRYANAADLSVEHVLFTNTSAKVKNIFDEIGDGLPVNPKQFSKVEEVDITTFINNVLPSAKQIWVLPENKHFPNLVTLLTAEHASSTNLFKWNNPFSWSYFGGIADSMKERVKQAGGKVDGVLRFSIQWNEDGKNNIDFDAHALEPRGQEICFRNFRKPAISPLTGQLDVDIINPAGKVAVENITWVDRTKLATGTYKFFVNNYSANRSNGGFKAEIEFDGQLYEFDYPNDLQGRQNVDVAEVYYDGAQFTLKSLLPSKNSVSSTTKWGVSTNTFVPVNRIVLSPNYWDSNPTGNKHYFFLLDGCQTDEDTEVRPFFNEYLKEDLLQHRKVFEVLSSKIAIPYSKAQLSGLGFSETQRASLTVKVAGRTSRIIKINF